MFHLLFVYPTTHALIARYAGWGWGVVIILFGECKYCSAYCLCSLGSQAFPVARNCARALIVRRREAFEIGEGLE